MASKKDRRMERRSEKRMVRGGNGRGSLAGREEPRTWTLRVPEYYICQCDPAGIDVYLTISCLLETPRRIMSGCEYRNVMTPLLDRNGCIDDEPLRAT